MGAYDAFYIIDTEVDSIKGTITITGKVNGPSRILLRPDEEVAFVSCAGSDFIAVIDLNSKTIIKKIEVPVPYLLLIP
jgi:DNA-binding beta-propeller fold protein YncE